MRLNNKELAIVSNKIFDEISKPIIEENKKKIKEYVLPEDHWFKKAIVDFEEYQAIFDDIYKRREEIFEKIRQITKLSYLNNGLSRYEEDVKKSEVSVEKYITMEEIQAEIILASNTDFETLIQTIIKKYKKDG